MDLPLKIEDSRRQNIVVINSISPTYSIRKIKLVLTFLLVIMLPVTVFYLTHYYQELKTLRSQLIAINNQSNDVSDLQQSISNYKSYHKKLNAIVASAQEAQLGDDFWIKRHIEVNKKQINRTDAAGFIDGVGKDENSFFKTAFFEIKTVKSGDDLFHYRAGDSNEVQMSMDGVFYTKIKNNQVTQ